MLVRRKSIYIVLVVVMVVWSFHLMTRSPTTSTYVPPTSAPPLAAPFQEPPPTVSYPPLRQDAEGDGQGDLEEEQAEQYEDAGEEIHHELDEEYVHEQEEEEEAEQAELEAEENEEEELEQEDGFNPYVEEDQDEGELDDHIDHELDHEYLTERPYEEEEEEEGEEQPPQQVEQGTKPQKQHRPDPNSVRQKQREADEKTRRMRSREAISVLLDYHYDRNVGMWSRNSAETGWWNSANGVEILANFLWYTEQSFHREGSQRVREREEKEHDLGVLRKKVKGQIENTFGKADIGKTIRGQFYDDGGWWALAWLRVHDLFCRDGILPLSSCIDGGISIEPHSTPTSRSPYLQRAMDIFSHMAKNAWDEKQCKGGAWWSKANKYKNAITNELFLSIAARLHLALGDSASAVRFPLDLMLSPAEQQRKEAKEGRKTKQLTTMTQKPVHTALGWAQKSWWWLERSGMINAETGLINDGLLEDGSCKTNLGITWTYNQGVILSGLADLYEATKDKNYIKQATKLVQAVMKHLVHDYPEAKVLREPCENHPVLTCDKDQRQFKGIFVRHLRYLMDVAAEFRVLDSRNEAALREFLEGNAESVWSHARDERNNRFGLEWGELRVSHRDATTQMAAIDALNSVMAL